MTGVVTDKGTIEAEYVVNCGGIWARELGAMAGVNVPLHAAEHYYLITEPIDGTGSEQQCLGKGCFAGIAVAENDSIPDLFDIVHVNLR